MFGLGIWELLLILLVILLIFGPKRLPQIGESLGKAIKALRKSQDSEETKSDQSSSKKETTEKE